jgi:hypothetical protein
MPQAFQGPLKQISTHQNLFQLLLPSNKVPQNPGHRKNHNISCFRKEDLKFDCCNHMETSSLTYLTSAGPRASVYDLSVSACHWASRASIPRDKEVEAASFLRPHPETGIV